MVDDAMTSTDAMRTRLAGATTRSNAARFAFRTYAFPMLTGTLITIAGFVPGRLRRELAPANILLAVFRCRHRADRLLVRRGLFTPWLGVTILKPPKAAKSSEPGWVFRTYRSFLTLALRAKWLTLAVTLALFIGSIFAMRLIPNQFFPSSDRPELLVDLTLPQNASIFASETVARRIDAVA